MSWGKAAPRDVITGRARVVPGQTMNVGDNENNLTANGRARTRVLLHTSATSDGQPAVTALQHAEVPMSNWLRLVLFHAGSNESPAERLPAEIHLPVLIDRTQRTIVDVDVDTAEAELQQFRDIAVERFKQTDSPLAGLRALRRLPGEATRGLRGVVSGLRDGIADLRADIADPNRPPPPLDPVEAEQRRRTARQMAANFEVNPKLREQARGSVVQAAPSMCAATAQGRVHPTEFDSWLEMQVISGLFTATEAAQFAGQAGRTLPPPV